jgi:hypothetical protein
MAAYFPKIYDVVGGNPFRDIELKVCNQIQDLPEVETWDIFFQKPLDPPGSLSQFLLLTDPLYSAATTTLRKQILIEKTFEIQERVDRELVGRKWSRKKIHDAFGEQVNAPKYSELMEHVLSELYQFQKILIHRKTKAISFFPSDLRLWKSDCSIYVGDDDGCWSYEIQKPKDLLTWITEKEEDSWKIQWPTADGKMEELKAEVLKRNLTAKPLPGSDSNKVKKEDWARTLGRSQAIEILARLRLTIQ